MTFFLQPQPWDHYPRSIDYGEFPTHTTMNGLSSNKHQTVLESMRIFSLTHFSFWPIPNNTTPTLQCLSNDLRVRFRQGMRAPSNPSIPAALRRERSAPVVCNFRLSPWLWKPPLFHIIVFHIINHGIIIPLNSILTLTIIWYYWIIIH